MSGLPEGVSRGPWWCEENIVGTWDVMNKDDKVIGVFGNQDDAEYVVEIINHEV